MAISWLKKIFGQNETPASQQQESQSPEPEFYEDEAAPAEEATTDVAAEPAVEDAPAPEVAKADESAVTTSESDEAEIVTKTEAAPEMSTTAPTSESALCELKDATHVVASVAQETVSADQAILEALNEQVSSVVDVQEENRAEDAKVAVQVVAEAETSHSTAEEPLVSVPEKKGFFSRLVSGLSRTSATIGAGITSIFVGKKISKELFIELEEKLLISDVGITATDKIIANLNQHVKLADLKDSEAVLKQLKVELKNIVAPCSQPLEIKEHTPFLILMVGVNGVGKTTTIGKLTKKLQAEGKSVLLAAGDTFRAAAIEQLQEWGNRNNVPVIAQKPNSDSAAVIYDAFNSAKAKGIDVVIADTAGRLQNKSHLLEELKKIVRVVQKLDPNAPHEVLITLDATTGQNALSQVELFDQAVNVTGIALTKLDGTAKGGVIFAICERFQKPVRFIGVGEKIDDLQPFNADNFIEALFESKE